MLTRNGVVCEFYQEHVASAINTVGRFRQDAKFMDS